MSNYDFVIASDHAGYNLKSKIIQYCNKKNISVHDLGTNSKESVDYPDLAKNATEAIIDEMAQFGILICATGIGMSMAANRNSQIRAALCPNEIMAKYARLHNNANVLVIGANQVSEEECYAMIEAFVNTKFEGGRHLRRIDKIS